MKIPSILRLFSNKLGRVGEFSETIRGNVYYEIDGVARVMCRKQGKQRPGDTQREWRFIIFRNNPKSHNHRQVVKKDMSFNQAVGYTKAMMNNG